MINSQKNCAIFGLVSLTNQKIDRKLMVNVGVV